MALEPITRKEKIIAGENLEPITRMEQFLKKFGGGGGGSVPKPLTFDYMPEGYPTKMMGTVTLMEEQEITFSQKGDDPLYYGRSAGTLEVVVGQTHTVNWDGTAYECVGFEFQGVTVLGNLSIVNAGGDTDEPFICVASNSMFMTIDTSASHTISVKRTREIVTPMAEEFIPSGVTAAIENAQVTAETAKTTANNAQTTANNAQTTANNAWTTAENAQTTANNAQTTANDAKTTAENAQTAANAALERVVEPYTRNMPMAPLYKNGGFSAWRDVVQSISYNKTEGYFYVNAFDTTAIKEEDIPRSVFCVDVYVGTQPATAFLSHFVTTDKWSVSGFAVITYNDSEAGELLYVSANTISKNEAKGLFLTFRAPGGMLLKSSTANSNKQFRITVDDSGTLAATEVI